VKCQRGGKGKDRLPGIEGKELWGEKPNPRSLRGRLQGRSVGREKFVRGEREVCSVPNVGKKGPGISAKERRKGHKRRKGEIFPRTPQKLASWKTLRQEKKPVEKATSTGKRVLSCYDRAKKQ